MRTELHLSSRIEETRILGKSSNDKQDERSRPPRRIGPADDTSLFLRIRRRQFLEQGLGDL